MKPMESIRLTPTPDIESDRLTARLQSGDAEAFAEFAAAWTPKITTLAFRMTANRHDALDVTQETLLRVHRGIQRFDRSAALSTWVYRVTLNTSHDFLRKRRSTTRLETAAAKLPAPNTAQTQHGSTTMDESNEVADALDQLPPSQREALVMRHYLGLTFPAIAEIVGEPVTTIKSRTLRALLQLRTLLSTDTPATEM